MRNCGRNSIKGGRCNAFNQHYKSETSDEVFNSISKKLDINGNICETLEKFFEFLSKYEKLNAKGIGSKYQNYREIFRKEKIDYNITQLNRLPIHE